MREIAKIPLSELKTSEWQLVGSESIWLMLPDRADLRWIQP